MNQDFISDVEYLIVIHNLCDAHQVSYTLEFNEAAREFDLTTISPARKRSTILGSFLR